MFKKPFVEANTIIVNKLTISLGISGPFLQLSPLSSHSYFGKASIKNKAKNTGILIIVIIKHHFLLNLNDPLTQPGKLLLK